MENTLKTIKIELSDKDREKLINLGALQWEENDIADLFGWPKAVLHEELKDESSEISRLLRQGEMQARFTVEAAICKKAASGDIEAIGEFNKAVRDRSFRIKKLDLFGGAEKEDVFDEVTNFMRTGQSDKMSEKERTYLELLQMAYSFFIRFGKRSTIKTLTNEPYNLSYQQAADVVGESLELFDGGRRVSKEAMRQHAADTYDTLYHATLEVAKTAKDFAMAAEILDKRNKLLGLDKPDEEPIDEKHYIKSYRLLSITPETIGLPTANRDVLAAQIDALEDANDEEKHRLKMDAQIVDTDIVEMLEDVQEESYQGV